MTMTNEEIVRHYRQAADKAADIKVLADLLCGMFEEYLDRRLMLETNHDG